MSSITDPKEKLKYPKCTWFIILNELCERFSYYGLKTVLVLYLTTILKFNGDQSTIIFHSFCFLSYFMPLPGAILADSYLGKFKVIIQLSIVYALGNIVLTSSSMADMFTLSIQRIIALLGLFLIAVGTGGIKPCVLPFGGDQFQLPQQTEQLINYNTNFMFAINLGALISSFLTPELRQDIHCFGKDTCFPLAFGVPALLMLLSLVIFIAGKNFYIKRIPKYNVISRTFGCIFYALRKKLATSGAHESHWLDYAKTKYTTTEISETKSALNLFVIFTAYPVFYALYEQQGSRWTLQATLMNGRIDFLNWTIKPDQMITLVPFFGLIFLVLFNVVLYPMLSMIGIKKPLQKLTLSGFLAIIAFVFATLLEFKIFGNTTVIPSEQGVINIYNGFDCNVSIYSPILQVNHIGPLDNIKISQKTSTSEENNFKITIQFAQNCPSVPENFEFNTFVTIKQKRMISYYLTGLNANTISLKRIGKYDNLIKEKYGNPNLRVLIDNTLDYKNYSITLNSSDINSLEYPFSYFQDKNFHNINMGKYNLFYNEQLLTTSINLIPATLYTLIIQRNGDKMNTKLFTMDDGNYIHILWQVPQYICMIMADVIFIVTSSEIAITKAPISIRSFISSLNLLTTSVGNLLIVIISSLSITNQAYEYLLYSGLMFIDTLLLAYFSVVY